MTASTSRVPARHICRLLGVTGVALIVGGASACAAPPHGGTGHEHGPSLAPAPAEPQPATRTVAITATDQLRFEPSTVSVRAGETVTFVVTNPGTLPHELVLDDQAAQQVHEEMLGSGAHGHGQMQHEHDADAVEVPAKGSATLVHRCDQPGTLRSGCDVAGHYGADHPGTVTVAPAEG